MRSIPVIQDYDTCFSRNDLYPYVEPFYRRCLQQNDINGLWAGLERHAAVLDPGFLYFRTLFYDVSLYYAHFVQQQSPLAPRLLAVLTFLLEQGHDPNRVSYYLRTALDEVRSTPAESILKAFGALDYAAVYDQRKADPSWSFYLPPQAQFIDFELDSTMGFDARYPQQKVLNAWGDTRLSVAVRQGDLETVKRCIDEGADVNFADHEGFTCLMHGLIPKLSYVMDHDRLNHYAKGELPSSFNGVRIIQDYQENFFLPVNSALITLLLDAGANPNHEALYGASVSQLALDLGDSQILAMLTQNGMLRQTPSPELTERPLAYQQQVLRLIQQYGLDIYDHIQHKAVIQAILNRSNQYTPPEPQTAVQVQDPKEAFYMQEILKYATPLNALYDEELYEGVSEAEIADFEMQWEFRLPAAYRAFLKVMGKKHPEYLFGDSLGHPLCSTFDTLDAPVYSHQDNFFQDALLPGSNIESQILARFCFIFAAMSDELVFGFFTLENTDNPQVYLWSENSFNENHIPLATEIDFFDFLVAGLQHLKDSRENLRKNSAMFEDIQRRYKYKKLKPASWAFFDPSSTEIKLASEVEHFRNLIHRVVDSYEYAIITSDKEFILLLRSGLASVTSIELIKKVIAHQTLTALDWQHIHFSQRIQGYVFFYAVYAAHTELIEWGITHKAYTYLSRHEKEFLVQLTLYPKLIERTIWECYVWGINYPYEFKLNHLPPRSSKPAHLMLPFHKLHYGDSLLRPTSVDLALRLILLDHEFISDALCKAFVNLGAYDGVRLLVDQGVDLNQQDEKGQTLFHHLLNPKALRTLLVGKKTAELVWTFGSAYYLTHTGYHYGEAKHEPTGYTAYKYYCAPEAPPSTEFLAAIQDILDHQRYTAQDIRTLMALGLDPDIPDHAGVTPRYILNHDAYWKAQDVW